MAGKVTVTALMATLAVTLAACQDDARLGNARAYQPIPYATMSLMAAKGMTKSDAILVRSYKKESELEIWKRNRDGRYALLKTYPICRWSGQLGPKTKEGDRQAPEGFYAITPSLMNPNSSFYLSFDTGFPNAYDRAHNYSGSFLMVHGACSSRGCFSMTDEQIAEIYAIGREAFTGGQRSFQFQSYPFRMTAENLAKHRNDPNIAFWKMLKEGSDHFEVTRQEPEVAVCGRRYVFNAKPAGPGAFLDASASCPPLTTDESVVAAVAAKQRADDAKVAELVDKGTAAVKLVYEDGGQHPSFRKTSFAVAGVGSVFAQGPSSQRMEVSRPEALERAPREVEIEASGKPKPTTTQPAKSTTVVALAPVSPRAGSQSNRQSSAKAETSATGASAAAVKETTKEEEGSTGAPYSRLLTMGGLFSSEKSSSEPRSTSSDTPLPPKRNGGNGQKSGSDGSAAKGQDAEKRSDDRKSTGLFGWLRPAN